MVVPDDPPIPEVIKAAQFYTGTDVELQLRYRQRSLWKALLPRVEVSWTGLRHDRYSLQQDVLYATLPFRYDDRPLLARNEFRVFAFWNLGDLVFNLDAALFGRIDRINYEIRETVKLAVHRYYGELRRLRVLMANEPPADLRTRLMYKLRIEELTNYINFITGNYLTHWWQGHRVPGRRTKWWQPWTSRR